jgi:hypothetical protein
LLLATKPTKEELNIWGAFAVLINMIFLTDLVLFLIIFGIKFVVQHKKVLFLEAGLQVMAIYATYEFF